MTPEEKINITSSEDENKYFVDIISNEDGETTGETTYTLLIGRLATDVTSGFTSINASQKLPLGIRLYEDTGYEEVLVHEIDSITPELSGSTRLTPLAFPGGAYTSPVDGEGTPAYAIEPKSREKAYRVPLLDKPIAGSDDDFIYNRSSIEKILRDYAQNTGMDKIAKFVEDKLDSLDGTETVADDYPGMYL